jgi:hypothetical protein
MGDAMSKTTWSGPHTTPIKAGRALVGYGSASDAHLCMTIVDFFGDTTFEDGLETLDSMQSDLLCDIGMKDNIVIQKRADGWYAGWDA